MKKVMKKLFVAFSVISLLALSSCSDDNKIIGTWSIDNRDTFCPLWYGETIVFTEDKMIIDTYIVDYILNNDSIKIQENTEGFKYWNTIEVLSRKNMTLYNKHGLCRLHLSK